MSFVILKPATTDPAPAVAFLREVFRQSDKDCQSRELLLKLADSYAHTP